MSGLVIFAVGYWKQKKKGIDSPSFSMEAVWLRVFNFLAGRGENGNKPHTPFLLLQEGSLYPFIL